ncbi:MAG TPA: 3'(2'),5'-bisphosphate nucleotidase CysQ [Kofleriaceae bacterium]|jgi:3'(2'), 5'-bisphosphate nucleotidase|nr:3'(2'),5'-bisphosphate nucleotidase CysQ [Kofleriaceae bacterium]
MSFARELQVAEVAARAAGELVARYYAAGPIAVEHKADASPVTAADRDANAAILEVLRAAFPGDAILSEESPDDGARLSATRVWIVDPLDGTRDFVKRTDDFAVHVGLAVDGEAVVGAVYLPVTRALFAAARGAGAWCEQGGARSALRVAPDRGDLRVGISRHHLSERLRAALDAGGIVDRRPIGASVKHMRVAAGELDAVINLSSGELEWDTCAPEVVLREAGGSYTDGDGAPFRYNQPDPEHHRGSIASSGASHARLVDLVRGYLG